MFYYSTRVYENRNFHMRFSRKFGLRIENLLLDHTSELYQPVAIYFQVMLLTSTQSN